MRKINVNSLTTAITTGMTKYYDGDHKQDSVELTASMAELIGYLSDLDDVMPPGKPSNLDIDEGNRDAVLEFIANARTAIERFTD